MTSQGQMARLEMKEPMSSSAESIDPQWWAGAFSDEASGFSGTLHMPSIAFAELAGSAPAGTLQRRVLEALEIATSALLRPDDWDSPFHPNTVWNGRRSALPEDLDTDQLDLLRRVLPLVEQRSLRARLADVLWLADRTDQEMLGLAIDSYTSAPLERDVWVRGGNDEWRRGLDLALRRGPAERARLRQMSQTLTARILAGDRAEGFMLCDLTSLAAKIRAVAKEDRERITEHLVSLAQGPPAQGERLSRRLERTAQLWMSTEDRNDSTLRVVNLYIAEAEERLARGSGAALAAGGFFENAITTIRTLPRSYRVEHDLDRLLADLKDRLRENREYSLETMITYESDPIDLTDAAAATRHLLTGLSKFEALATFSTVFPLPDVDRINAHARDLAEGSLSLLFGSTTLTPDGRKVASSEGAEDHRENAIRADQVRQMDTLAGMVAAASIVPGLEVISYEHHYDLYYLLQICAESPYVPTGHEYLWARGLLHGLNGDFPSAVSILVPQIEHLVRSVLKQLNVDTLFRDKFGVESEKSLPALLEAPEATRFLGEPLVFAFKSLLVSQEGANLRHDVAHGLLTDGQAWSAAAVYIWWLCLRIVVAPLQQMRQPPQPEGPPDEPDQGRPTTPTGPGDGT